MALQILEPAWRPATRQVIPLALSFDLCPIAFADGADDVRELH
jgi:hypothetical protein